MWSPMLWWAKGLVSVSAQSKCISTFMSLTLHFLIWAQKWCHLSAMCLVCNFVPLLWAKTMQKELSSYKTVAARDAVWVVQYGFSKGVDVKSWWWIFCNSCQSGRSSLVAKLRANNSVCSLLSQWMENPQKGYCTPGMAKDTFPKGRVFLVP